jgi:hypothetical protein
VLTTCVYIVNDTIDIEQEGPDRVPYASRGGERERARAGERASEGERKRERECDHASERERASERASEREPVITQAREREIVSKSAGLSIRVS